MALHPNSPAIIEYLQCAIDQLAKPIATAQAEEGEAQNVLGLLWGEFNYIALHFTFGIGERMSEKEVLIYIDIGVFLGAIPEFASNLLHNPNTCQGLCNHIYEGYLQNPNFYQEVKISALVRALHRYDVLNGTDCAEKAKNLLFQLANSFLKADDRVSKQKEIALLEYKELLYPKSASKIESEKYAPQKLDVLTSGISNKNEESSCLEELLEELNSLIGLDTVKNDVVQLVNFLKVQQIRELKGMAAVPVSRHLVFYGNPGTGKTTIARKLAQIYKSLNILSKGHLVETDRSGLVAGYVGQTALKVQEVVNKAIGGILFIDEAYSLTGGNQDYGQEAIDTLIKLMEDNRDDLIVVVAGYTDKMGKFLESNPGLKSRFNKYFFFEDYSPLQLVKIFMQFCKQGGFKLPKEAGEKLLTIFQKLHDTRDETFGNARTARNIFERAISNQANRIVNIADINEEHLSRIEAIDIPDINELRAIDSIGNKTFKMDS